MRTSLIAATAVVAALSASPAAAQIDFVEQTFGATHLGAQSGNGGLTVGLAPTGEITVLSWPSPSFHDQVEYLTAAGEDARALPHFGADDSDGVFAGLWVEIEGAEPVLTWLRDAPWSQEQLYASDHSAAIENRYRHDALGLKVTEWTAVDGQRDVLLRRARVERSPESMVTRVWYVVYENLAPATEEPDDLTITRMPDDAANDYAAFWDPSTDVLVHFRPDNADNARLNEVLIQPWTVGDSWQAVGLPLMRDLAAELGTGSFVVVGGAQPPTGAFVGTDADAACTGTDAWVWTPSSAWDVVGTTINTASTFGSPLAGCDANAILAWELPLDAPGTIDEATVDLFLAAGGSWAMATATLEQARTEGFDAALARTDAANAAWLDGLNLPVGFGTDDEDEVIAFSQRWALSVRQGTDRDTGAIIASIATQPTYHQDWPRDSAFFDFALDVAGLFDQVSQHQAFLDQVQNKAVVFAGTEDAPTLGSPPGAWLMHFYADGTPATLLVNRFEIDQVGLSLWNFWSHALFAPNESKARDVLAARWESIRAGANLLAACVQDEHPAAIAAADRATVGFPGWWPVYQDLLAGTVPDADARAAAIAGDQWEALRPCTAVEDDALIPTVSIYSTHVTRLGLLSAARAADALCIDDPVVDYWRERAHELGAVAFKLYYDEASATWDERADWLLWPEPIDIDPAQHASFSSAATAEERATEVASFVSTARDAAAASWQAEVADAVSLRTEGAAYENKKTLNIARYRADGSGPRWSRTTNQEHVRRFAVDLPTPGTRHVGEVFLSLDTDGDGVADTADQRTAQPHLWAATLTYLSAMAIARPDLFDPAERSELQLTCPNGLEPELQREAPACGADCQNSVGGRSAQGWSWLLLVFIGLARRRR